LMSRHGCAHQENEWSLSECRMNTEPQRFSKDFLSASPGPSF
jgi:hypothetical protein